VTTSQPLTSPAPTAAEAAHPDPATSPWWRDAVIYQVYPRSYADSDGDGVGDLPGITSKVPYLSELGVDAIWVSPFYVSPQADAGYDVADYLDIDPIFGTLADADAFIEAAHGAGIKVVVDLVPNHSSDEHAWFRAALASAPGSPEREMYMFRDGKGAGGEEPPTDWQSVFGGPAWTRVTEPDGTPGQWYLHLFDAKQPDLNWSNPKVHTAFHDILRFWLDRGVDGFRVDVAHGLVKEEGLPDWASEHGLLDHHSGDGRRAPMWDQDGVHEVYQEWRAILDSYDGDRMMVAEAWVEPAERRALYVRPDEFQQAFNFGYLEAAWRADDLRTVIEDSLAADAVVGATTTWVLSNHDVIRHATRLALPVGERRPNGIGPDDPQPDAELGLRRARAATLLMLALPGSAYLYQGEELGLPDHTELPGEVRQDPTWFRTDHEVLGRDGCRIPIPWTAEGPSLGFGPTGQTWLPQPESYQALAADQQVGVPGSTLEMYRAALRLRREHALGLGSVVFDDSFGPDAVALRNGTVLVVTNLGDEPVSLPTGAEVLLTSGELVTGDAGEDSRAVPTDTTVWVRA
jgi:alpha-glucosidase